MKLVLSALLLSVLSARASGADADPFAGVSVSTAEPAAAGAGFFRENFGFRKELLFQAEAEPGARAAFRESAGFEVLKKFSTETATWAAVDFQGRAVRRDRFVPVLNDMEGMNRRGWFYEYHNAYADVYDPAGRLNVRAGRFYLPFGLNVQTDTHGTVLQLSNERNFGFERDWQAGLWGRLTDDADYNAAYLAGSGYDLKSRGQGGLGSGRVGLSNRFSSEYGLEGGVSGLGGERLAAGAVVNTSRFGVDARLRRPAPTGTVSWTSELSAGKDDADGVFTQLHQAEYLHGSRRWGLAAQFRRFTRAGEAAESSAIVEATWYFRNDVAASNLHWVKLNVERPLEGAMGRRGVIAALQYYRYW